MATTAARSPSVKGLSTSRSVSISLSTSPTVAAGSNRISATISAMTELLPLVLLHAFPLDARMWDPVRAPLAERLRVITPDQRGLGRSPLPETDREPSLDDAAQDVLAL